MNRAVEKIRAIEAALQRLEKRPPSESESESAAAASSLSSSQRVLEGHLSFIMFLRFCFFQLAWFVNLLLSPVLVVGSVVATKDSSFVL